MGRRERFIMPSEEELREMAEAEEAKVRLIERRHALTEKSIRSTRKDELVQILMKLCRFNVHARWTVEAELELDKPVEMVLLDLNEAIRIATQADESKSNSNFWFDMEAYAEVNRLMTMLISQGALAEAMNSAITFMERASRQIELSDEGMMLPYIEEGMQPVLSALENHDPQLRAEWARQMQMADRVGLVCYAKLEEWSNVRAS